MTKPLELTANQINFLEVCGFDLLAQVEALLRHAREYQRELHRVQRAAGRTPAIVGFRRQVHHLRQVCGSLSQTLELITDMDRREPAAEASSAESLHR